MDPSSQGHLVGADVGSTTVKAVVVRADSGAIVWRDYRRHETRQPDALLDCFRRMEAEAGVRPRESRLFMTGSGARALAPLVGARFVQEVTAVALAVERLYPRVRSVIELGGQDAKIVVFKPVGDGRMQKIPSMNDRCAGGTGAIIDKIAAKLAIPPAALGRQGYAGLRIHPVAGKCGVFAETDINSLQKQGVPPDELMASLFDALVLQNLTVLARGHTLLPDVLLVGGPNTFIRGMREAWQHNLPRLWRERGIALPDGARPQDLVFAPPDGEYFAAIGAVEYGRHEADGEDARYTGTARLAEHVASGSRRARGRPVLPGLVATPGEREAFEQAFAPPPFTPPAFAPGETVGAFLGLDAGSTSTKGVLLSPRGEVLAKAYRLSNGNPIADAIEIVERLRRPVEAAGARLDVLGAATTGYAKDVLGDVISADVALVETVAHAEAARRAFADPHVVLDVGGQDIKLIVLSDGRVKDFRLNTQCSAGTGYFLQATAERFGLRADQYADAAFAAGAMPEFGFGCAVFLQSDIVDCQRFGWSPNEILAGLAAVLPKNVFLHVAGVPNLSRLGTRFVLQGGTQHNLAAVKALVDYIRGNFRPSGMTPEIAVHPHPGETGAIGAALEAIRLWEAGRHTTFVGLDAVRAIRYRTTADERTRCRFCKNRCIRTFIDVQLGDRARPGPAPAALPVPLEPGARRVIVATCEQGAVEALDAMREIKAEIDLVRRSNPNLVDEAAREVWKPRHPPPAADSIPSRAWSPAARRRVELMRRRGRLRVGIPRVLNLYFYAPLFSAYLESLGVGAANIVYSGYTTSALYRAGAGRGAIDPCYPSKIALAHVNDLLTPRPGRAPLDVVFFPMLDVLDSPLVGTRAQNACPTVTTTPMTVLAAFTKERDVFAERHVTYLHPLLNLGDRRLFAGQMFQAWAPVLGLGWGEHARAIEAGRAALDTCWDGLRRRARETIDRLEREDRLGIVMLGRPYHHDPGINHEVLGELQKRGYPVFSQHTLPLDADLLDRLFGDEVRAGVIGHPLDISDVWKNTTSASTNQKIWAAKFTARHPNLAAVELSSFKCGHDAPVYTVIEQIIECSGTPYFAFKDIDENRAAGSIRIRVETIDYFLRRVRDDLVRRKRARPVVDRTLAGDARRLCKAPEAVLDRVPPPDGPIVRPPVPASGGDAAAPRKGPHDGYA